MVPTQRKTSPSFTHVVRYANTDPKDPIAFPRTSFGHRGPLLPQTSEPRSQQFESHHPPGMLGRPAEERGRALTWLKSIRARARLQHVDGNSSPTLSLTSRTTRYISNIRKKPPIMDTAKSPIRSSNLLHTTSQSSYQHLHLDLTHSYTSFPSPPVLNSECRQTLTSPVKLEKSSSLASTSTLPQPRKLVRVLQPISKNLSLVRKPRGASSVRQQLSIAVARSTMSIEEQSDPSPPTAVTSDAPSSSVPAAPRQSSETLHPPSRMPPLQLEAGGTNPKGENTNLIQTFTPSSVSLCKSPDHPLPPQSTHRRPISNPTEYGARHQIDLGAPRENPVRIQQQKRPTTAPAAFPAPFQANAIPSQSQLSAAASLTVIAENRVRRPFGDLFLRSKIAVIFIRHFWSVRYSFYTSQCC